MYPFYKFMRVGIVHFMAYPSTMKGDGPILETVQRIAADDYFSAIELTRINDPDIRKKVRAVLETAKMSVAYGAQPLLLTSGMNINDVDATKRMKAVLLLKDGIDEAYELGASGFAFLSGKYDEATKEESYKALVESTIELCEYAKSNGDMKVALEVFDYAIDKKSLIGPVSLAKRYAEDITAVCKNFGLMVDLSHLPLLGETAKESLEPVKDHIIHAHMGNCVVKDKSLPGYGDMHPRFGFPGSENDTAELVTYLKTLFDIGFLDPAAPPIVSFEVKPFGDEDSEMVIANAKRTLNRAWSML